MLVVGDVIDDIVVAPTAAVRADTDTEAAIVRRPGGSAANAAAWFAAAGATVSFVGRVGRADVARVEAELGAHGIHPHLVGDPIAETGAIVVLVEGERRTMLTQRGANGHLSGDDVGDALLARHEHLHLTAYSLQEAPTRASARRLIGRALAAGLTVSVDPSSAGLIADLGAATLLDLVAGAHVLLPNRDEALALAAALAAPTGAADLGRVDAAGTAPALDTRRGEAAHPGAADLGRVDAAALALARRFPVVAVTLGPDGAAVAVSGAVHRVAAEPARTVDAIGAGDAFAAGFVLEWLRSGDPAAAARAGCALGARAVTAYGGRPVTRAHPS